MYIRTLAVTLGLSLLVLAPASAQEPQTQAEKFSYTMGYKMGKALMQWPYTEIDEDVLIQALHDSLNKLEPRMKTAEMDAAVKVQREHMLERIRADNLARSQEFLEKNAKRDGIMVTDSGLQYEVLEPGGGAQPEASDAVKVQYEGSLIDGTVFDSSYKRGKPATLHLDTVIKGWQEGLQLMKVGATYKFYIPPELAYGERGHRPVIGPNEALIFKIELLGIE